MMPRPLFRSFFAAGFECSSHRRFDGRRIDCIASTAHDRCCDADYSAIVRHGLRTARDGFRWHLIEAEPGRYDWSSALPMLRAARRYKVQVIWDLCHYGWPEMSYWAWAGTDGALMNPFAPGCAAALKRRLVEATMAAMAAVRAVAARARFLHVEPCVNIIAARDEDRAEAEGWHLAQYEALDMLAGRSAPELRGNPGCLDIVGVNYYPGNQWYHGGSTIPMGLHSYRPFRDLLAEVYARYERPLMISETGAEGSGRGSWLHYICGEVDAARQAGIPVEAICLYPILDYPGWANDRPCEVGLFTPADADGRRSIHESFAAELHRQQRHFFTSDNVEQP